jgi:putative two-component system protein, hydrogenase maturation factor HypX/HoxX
MMTTYTATASPPDAAVIADVDRADAGPRACLRILFIVSAHNSLSQRVWTELTDLGHEVAVAVVASAEEMEPAVAAHRPELIVCPMLKTMIPERLWARHRCLIVHPGPRGDRGPSSLDWAIELDARDWGVTVLEANAQADAGAAWASRSFKTRTAGKSSLYRHEVRRGAIEAVCEAVSRIAAGATAPSGSWDNENARSGRARPLMTQSDRAIDWRCDLTETIIRRLRAAEGHPGVLDNVAGVECHLFGAHPESSLRGDPGAIVAQRHGAICRATVDGAVWITHLKRRDTASQSFFKLPAARTLELAGVPVIAPEVPAPLDDSSEPTWREIAYTEHAGVGRLRFDFYNGAMSTEQCRRLLDAYRYACSRTQTRVIVLAGGRDFFSNGIHLNVIEAAADPARESWENLNAIDDLVGEIINTGSHLVIAALEGDAAAGGVPLALAADRVYAREDAVLNPYYGHMGGLYGSEFWTYLLPRRVGPQVAAELTGSPFTPLSAAKAARIGLIDSAFGLTADAFRAQLMQHAQQLAADPALGPRLELKRIRRADDERTRPLATYRKHELERCQTCFFGPDRSYHDARHRFVYKLGAPCAADAATQLRAAVKHYERNVLAWYALGRSADAQAARDTIERRRRAARPAPSLRQP